jgi:hypothetical protein
MKAYYTVKEVVEILNESLHPGETKFTERTIVERVINKADKYKPYIEAEKVSGRWHINAGDILNYKYHLERTKGIRAEEHARKLNDVLRSWKSNG